MKNKISRIIDTEILSVGGSGAAVTGAIYATRNGAKVTIVSKGKIGYSGNIIMAGGGFGIDGESGKNILNLSVANPEFTKEKLFDCIVKESFFLCDQNMVEQYVDDSPIIAKEYLGWAERANQKYYFVPPATWIGSGRSFSKPLVQALKETDDIDILEDVTIVELLTKDNTITGAIGVDIYTGEIILFRAKAVIIATGGFQPFSNNNTVTDMTGDGVAMAYRAGAMLTDMEFILGMPTALVPHNMKGSIYPYVFEYNMRNLKFTIRDNEGNPLNIPENIIKLSRGGKLSKLVSTYYLGNAIEDGLDGENGGLFYDYSQNSLQEKKNFFESFYNLFDNWHRHGYYNGESLAEVEKMIYEDIPLEVGIAFEYSMGGVEVNEKMETAVAGLFVAGEASSGVFGACRVGDGLTEMLCQGMRAGISSAEYCKATNKTQCDDSQVEEKLGKILKYFNNKNGKNPIKLFREIRETCDNGFGIIRCEEKLKNALQKILILKEDIKGASLDDTAPEYNNQWLCAIEAENLLVCCEAGIRAAIERKESRGCHIRKDYPQVNNDEYIIKYLFNKCGDEMKLGTRKPKVTRLALPGGKKASVIDYFLDKQLNYKR